MSSVYFRADGNHSVGLGHVMRCLSIADAFSDIGYDVVFILADESVKDIVSGRGYGAVVLDSNYADMDSEISMWESKVFGKTHDKNPDYLVIDSYYVTENYLTSLKQFCGEDCKIVYIDDVAAFPYPCDVLVNYNAYAEKDGYDRLYTACNIEPKLILGCTYAPLREMFCGCDKRVQNKNVKNVLISTGGSDELHISLELLRYLLDSRSESSRGENTSDKRVYHFLIGGMNKDADEIKALASDEKSKSHVVIHQNVADMRGLLEEMDLVVSAAGSTLYEISAVGIPLITYITADNQIPGAEAFERLGLAINLGDMRIPGSADPDKVISGKLDRSVLQRILDAVDKLSEDYNLRVEMGARMQELIDGKGAERLVDHLKDWSN